MQVKMKKRILIIDDVPEIHEDFRRIFEEKTSSSDFDAALASISNTPSSSENKSTYHHPPYIIDSAYQGADAVEMVKKGFEENNPYALAFVDVRMPPGLNGIMSIIKMWQIDPDIQVVICTAYSDYSWDEMSKQLNHSDNFLILKKPFDVVEIRQLAAALTKKWELKKEVQYQLDHLHDLVKAKTEDLDNALSLSTATLESTKEGILVVNNEGEIVLFNNVFLSLWNLSTDVMKQKNLNTLLIKLSESVNESALFSHWMMDLTTNPKTGVIREWDLSDGKIIELYTHPQLLHGKIIGCVFSFLDITARKILERKLQFQTTHDDLTGLPNRSLNIDRILQAIAYAKRNDSLVAILMFDLDNFKSINDNLSTDVGDAILIMVATRLSRALRDTDSISRLSGDEFVVLITSFNEEADLLARINQIFSLFQTPFEINSEKISVTASLGISIFPRDGEDPQTLLKNADIALHHSKESGRNMLQFYQPKFSEKLFNRVDIASQLHLALNNHEFILEYQPIIDLKTNQIIGVEALIRWKHSTLGVLQPDSFIPLAEKSGLINEIGKWVLKSACEQKLKWQKIINPELTMAVNISGYQLRKNEFFDDVLQIIKETEIDPHTLIFEITETAILGNPTEISHKMQKLKELGIKFAIDDFGTGYSTFNYLKYYSFDYIKIDKSFIQGITTNMEDKAIVETIIHMSNTLAVKVLAEGVEKIEQINFLKERKVQQVQGYFYSPPLPPEECLTLLKESSVKDPVE